MQNDECGGFTGTSTGDTQPQRRGDRPFIPLSKRIDMALATYKHSVFRAVVRRDFSESTCYLGPAYTGGTNSRPVAVDGALRIPQCFGGMGEPWAQLGEDDCGDTSDVNVRVVDIHVAPSVRVLRPITAH